ncbi:pyridoxamine 5'-phosphate oxidase family protein [Nocardiopsis ansamitocini]|uniref:pyridoxamine 5'-phosphate oxidase family protein n=1 Tax=Nocardiopsis ansamitocini TaxID=1670832 RepID=UPI00255265BD|nr:pyridoxamine 5'-phosphate oxidase family protein [Nocardiopsis ansamitocini]
MTATPIASRTAEAIDTYRTGELTTLGADGTPLTWPTAVWRHPDDTLLITTSLAYAQKALNVRRDGRVSVLFSDPTGSGRADLPQVFVSGTATCPEEILTGPGEAADYWRRLFERQPHSLGYVRAPGRWLMDWYYMRLSITITPDRVETRIPLTEQLAAGPVPGQDPAQGTETGSGPLGADLVARFPSGVLGVRDASGAPLLARVRPRATDAGFVVEADVPEGAVPGKASLLVHRHDEHLNGMHNALVRGELHMDGEQWVLVPSKVIEPMGAGNRSSAVRILRDARRSTNRYLERRGLDRPRIEWGQFQELFSKSSPA